LSSIRYTLTAILDLKALEYLFTLSWVRIFQTSSNTSFERVGIMTIDEEIEGKEGTVTLDAAFTFCKIGSSDALKSKGL
jgi:hypothetical protein